MPFRRNAISKHCIPIKGRLDLRWKDIQTDGQTDRLKTERNEERKKGRLD